MLIFFLSSLALEKWSLGPADLRTVNPSLIFTRVSGYGQTGPWATRPGYAAVCEAESGFRYINGFPDPETGSLSGAPVRPNMSLGDSVAGLHAAFGTVSQVKACLYLTVYHTFIGTSTFGKTAANGQRRSSRR
jgi:crotonobetainyl-CoA:carnitine CoA-transferase CaiB-like acyl-CoA transferase